VNPKEREGHIRHLALLIIMHLEGEDVSPRSYDYLEALRRLRGLLDVEIDRATPVGLEPATQAARED
jgi:hypothetical protein